MRLSYPAGPLRLAYESASPFPHIALDGLFPEDDLERVLNDFPGPNDIEWTRFDSPTERKLGYFHEKSRIRDTVRDFLYFMNSFPVLLWLEELTGIEGLIPDPYFGGGGLHQILPGGFLKIHTDFNWHPKLRLDRRLNLLLYLNKDWKEEYGGHLELWNRSMTRCEKRILPVFGRTAIFSTTDSSYHGHPTPLTCPEGMTRKSVSLYYYTNGRPAGEASWHHDTVFQKRDEADW